MKKKFLSVLLAGMMLVQTAGSAAALEFTSEDLFVTDSAVGSAGEDGNSAPAETDLFSAAENTGGSVENLPEYNIPAETVPQSELQTPEEIFFISEEIPSAETPSAEIHSEDAMVSPVGELFADEDIVQMEDSPEAGAVLQDEIILTENGQDPAGTGLEGQTEEESEQQSDPLQDPDSLMTASVSKVLEDTEEQYIEADLPGDRNTLPFWETRIGKESGLFVWNDTYKNGMDFPLYFSNLRVSNPDLAEVEDRGDAWVIRSLDTFGSVTVTLDYSEPEATHTSGTHSFELSISGDVYELELRSQYGTHRLLPGKDLPLVAKVYHEAYSREQGHHMEDASSVSFEWSLPDPEQGPKGGLEIVSKGDGAGLNLPDLMAGATATVKAKTTAEPNAYPVRVTIYETVSGEKVKVGWQDHYIGVRPEYFQLTPSILDPGIGLGESTKTEPLLHSMRLNEDGSYSDDIVTDGIFFRWYFDRDSIQIMNDRENQPVMGDELFSPGTSFTVRRMSPHYLEYHLQAVRKDEESGEWEVLGENYLWFEDIHTEIRLTGEKNPNDPRNYLLFDNSTVEVCIDRDSVSHLPLEDDLLEFRWTLGRYNEAEDRMEPLDGFYTVAPDGLSVTVNGEKAFGNDLLRKNGGISVEVNLYYNGREFQGTGTWIELRESREDYDLPCREGGRNTLPGWNMFIDRQQNCYVENSEMPRGENVSFAITKVSVTGGDKDIVRLEEQENGWEIRSQRAFGQAVFTVEYTDIHGVPKTHTFTWSVSGDQYDLNVWFADRNNWVQPGKTIDLFAETYHHAFVEGRGHYEEDTSAITYKWIIPEESAGKLSIIAQNGGQATLQAGNEEGYYNIRVEAYDPARGSTEPVAVQHMDLHVQKGYWVPMPGLIRRDLKPGESLVIEPKMVSYGTDRNGNSVIEDLPNVGFRWYYDENQISIVDGNGAAVHPAEGDSEIYTSGCYTLTRKDPRDFEVRLQFFTHQENGEWRECGWRNYRMDGVEIDCSFAGQNMYDHYVVFADSTTLVSIDPESLLNIDLSTGAYEFMWRFGRYDEETDDLDTSYGDSFYTISTDGLSAVIRGQDLQGIPALWDRGLDVWVKLLCNGEEIHQIGTHVETRYPEDEIEELNDDDMLPGWTNEYRSINHWVVNEKYPEGEDLECPILQMSAVNEDPDQEEPVVTVSKRDDGTWLIHGENGGCAIVSYTYDLDGTSVQDQFRMYVTDDWYRTWISAEEDYNQLLPGQEKKLFLNMLHKQYSVKTGEVDAPTDHLRVEWILQEDDNPAISQAITLTPSKDGRSATLKAGHGYYGGARVEVIVYDEEDDEVNRTQWWFNVQEGTDVLVPTELNLNLKAGETYGPFDVYREDRYLDEDGNIKTEKATYQNFRYRWEFDPALVQITDTNGKAVGSYNGDEYVFTPGSFSTFENGHRATFKIKKLKHEEARITLVEEWQDGKGNFHEGHRREYVAVYNGAHAYGAWKVTKQATVFATGVQQRVCPYCGAKQTKTIAKLKPTITVKAGTTAIKTKSTVNLRKGKSAVLTFSGLARGDAYYTVTSSNKKIATVKRSGSKITIKGVKAGKAVVKLFLKSNKKTPIYQLTVNVKSADIKTTGITIAKSFTVKAKKKITLKPVLKPFTSTQKVTYSVAKVYSKFIKVTSAGVVTGLKKGKGIVTIKSGSKKVNVTITVK